jgi:hypothetical protein
MNMNNFFWTKETVQKLMDSIEFHNLECCCLTTPSLAHAYHESGEQRTLLDIDDRFKYLPNLYITTYANHFM